MNILEDINLAKRGVGCRIIKNELIFNVMRKIFFLNLFIIISFIIFPCAKLESRVFKIKNDTMVIHDFLPFNVDSIPGVSKDYHLGTSYKYGQGEIDEAIGKTFQSFILWLKDWYKTDKYVLVFNRISTPVIAAIDFEGTTAEEQELSSREQEAWFDTFGFEIYPQYSGCDFEKLIKDRNVLLFYRVSLKSGSRINIDLKCYVPNVISNEKIREETYDYLVFNLEYLYNLEWPNRDNPKKLRDDLILFANNFYSYYENETYSPEKRLKYANSMLDSFLNRFSWALSEIHFNYVSNELFDNNNMPKTLRDFGFY